MTILWIWLSGVGGWLLLVFGAVLGLKWSADRAEEVDPVDEPAEEASAELSPAPLLDAALTETEQSTFDELIRAYYSTDAYPQHYWPPVVPGPEESR